MEKPEIDQSDNVFAGQTSSNIPGIVLADLSSEHVIITLNPPTPPISEELKLSVRSPLKSSASNTSVLCRICHEYDDIEDLIGPCECSGSMALVHQRCLNQWLFMSGRNLCEICGKHLSMQHLEERQLEEPTESRWSPSPSWVTIVFLFIFSIGLSLFYCTNMTNSKFEFWTAVTLVSLNIVACASICFHACYSPRQLH